VEGGRGEEGEWQREVKRGSERRKGVEGGGGGVERGGKERG